MPSDLDLSRLVKALGGQAPADPRFRVKHSQVTTREVHPDWDFRNTLAALKPQNSTLVSLNTANGGKKFMWNVQSFGWDQADFD